MVGDFDEGHSDGCEADGFVAEFGGVGDGGFASWRWRLVRLADLLEGGLSAGLSEGASGHVGCLPWGLVVEPAGVERGVRARGIARVVDFRDFQQCTGLFSSISGLFGG